MTGVQTCALPISVGHDKGIVRTVHDSFVFYEADKDDDIPSGHINKMGAAIRFARLESN